MNLIWILNTFTAPCPLLICFRSTAYCWRYKTLRSILSKHQRRTGRLCWNSIKLTLHSSATHCWKRSGTTGTPGGLNVTVITLEHQWQLCVQCNASCFKSRTMFWLKHLPEMLKVVHTLCFTLVSDWVNIFLDFSAFAQY